MEPDTREFTTMIAATGDADDDRTPVVRALDRIADALERVSSLGTSRPQDRARERFVGLDEATLSPFEVGGAPIVRYQLPDKKVVRWQVVEKDPLGRSVNPADRKIQLWLEDPDTGERWRLVPVADPLAERMERG